MLSLPTTGVDVASNSALNHQTSTAKTASAASLEAGNDLPFRRQDFDRNSVLRRSKKRRKSSSAGTSSTNINSPNKAVVSGDRDTSNTTPKKVEAAEKQPVNISNNNNNDRTQRRSSSQQGLKIFILKKTLVHYFAKTSLTYFSFYRNILS